MEVYLKKQRSNLVSLLFLQALSNKSPPLSLNNESWQYTNMLEHNLSPPSNTSQCVSTITTIAPITHSLDVFQPKDKNSGIYFESFWLLLQI